MYNFEVFSFRLFFLFIDKYSINIGILYAISGKIDDDCSISCAFINEFWITFQNLMKEMGIKAKLL
jgi:hypothetical protein